MECEYCGKDHDGSYASGRFCSQHCARGFSSRDKREEINRKVSKKLSFLPVLIKTCEYCKKGFNTKKRDQRFCSKRCTGKSGVLNNNLKVATKESHRRNKGKWSEIHRRAYANGNNYVAGGTTSWIEVFTSNGIIKVQGSYEVRTCKILDYWKSFGKIKDWEYTNDRFQYVGVDGENHTYLVDFKVFTSYGGFYYVEPKGYVKENDPLKWQAVKEAGYKLEVWFLEDIEEKERGCSVNG